MPGTTSHVKNTVGLGELNRTNVYRLKTPSTPESSKPMLPPTLPSSTTATARESAYLIISSRGFISTTSVLGFSWKYSVSKASEAPATIAKNEAQNSRGATRQTVANANSPIPIHTMMPVWYRPVRPKMMGCKSAISLPAW